MSPAVHRFRIATDLAATPGAVWRHVTAMDGVNDEMRPLLRMTVPPGGKSARIDDLPYRLAVPVLFAHRPPAFAPAVRPAVAIDDCDSCWTRADTGGHGRARGGHESAQTWCIEVEQLGKQLFYGSALSGSDSSIARCRVASVSWGKNLRSADRSSSCRVQPW